jgi:hypothetical protein
MFIDLHTVSGYDGTGGQPIIINVNHIATARPAGGATVGSKSEPGGTDIMLSHASNPFVRVREPYDLVKEMIHKEEKQ